MPGGAVMERVERACAAGECEKAIDLLEGALRLQPDGHRLHFLLGLCYAGGCRTHALTNPDMAVAYLRRALRATDLREPGDRRMRPKAPPLRRVDASVCPRVPASSRAPSPPAGPAAERAGILDALGNALVRSTKARQQALRDAIVCHREAADLYAALGRRDDWARTQFNLGNSCCDLGEATGEDHWQEAVDHYRRSLKVRTRQKDPARYAAVLENLGTAYRRASTDDAGAGVKKCIACYRRALRVYSPDAYPGKNAALENNIGNAFLSLPQRDQKAVTRNARRALDHFVRALQIQRADRCSRAYGITQYNRAQAYFRLARVSPSGNLEMAAACLEEARAAFECCGEDGYAQRIRAQLARP